MKAFIILALGATQVFNIESNVDSLINLTKDPNLTDSAKINIYNNLIDKYLYKNLDSALLFSDLGEQLAVESENQIEYGNFQLSKAIVYYFKSKDDSALHFLNKASVVFTKEKYQKGLLRTSNNLGLVHSNMGNYDVALKHYLEAIKTAEQLNDYYMLV